MTNNKSIVFVNQSSGYLMVEIVNPLYTNNHENNIITGDIKKLSDNKIN